MPGNFFLKSFAAPTDLGGSLASGGNLAPRTTYYYQVFCYERERGFQALTISPRSDTFSITTTDSLRTVQLTWSPPPGFTASGINKGFVVLRNTAPDFPDSDNVCLMRPGEAHYWNYLATNSFTDDGVCPLGQTCHFKGGLPTIGITGGTDQNPVTMWDLYQWAQTNAPGRIKPALDPAFMDFEASGWKKDGISWVIHANLACGWDGSNELTTHFKYPYHGALLIYGMLWSTCQAHLTFGRKVNNGRDADVSDGPLMLVHQPATGGGYLFGDIKAYNLRLQQGGRHWGNYAFSGWNNPYNQPSLRLYPGSEILDCDFGSLGNGYDIKADLGGPYAVRRCRLAGIVGRGGVVLERPHITGEEGLGLRHEGGVTVTAPTVTYAPQDLIWRTTFKQTVIDGIFASHGQADNRPWIFLGYANGPGGSLTFQYTVKGTVSDPAGTPISGAEVVIRDQGGATVYAGATDDHGRFEAGALTARVLSPTPKVHGVFLVEAAPEDSLVAEGWLNLSLNTPHTLTIEKSGYQPYVDVINLTEKKELDVALTPVPAPVYLAVPSGSFAITAACRASLEVAVHSREIEVACT